MLPDSRSMVEGQIGIGFIAEQPDPASPQRDQFVKQRRVKGGAGRLFALLTMIARGGRQCRINRRSGRDENRRAPQAGTGITKLEVGGCRPMGGKGRCEQRHPVIRIA